MKKISISTLFLIGTLLLFQSPAAHAQYTPQCAYLQNPNLAIGYVDSCAKFWISANDSSLGGFYTNIDRAGNLITTYGTNKDLLSQDRDAYGFTRAFMLTGNEFYLTMARRALTFMYQHAWDNTNGGWFASMDKFGNPSNTTSSKSAFDQHYALVGMTASYEATQDTTDWSWIMRGYANNENKFWDSNSQTLGYYDVVSADGSSRTGKSFNATVDAVTTHVLGLYLLTGSDTYKTRLQQLAANMTQRLAPTLDQNVIGFVEAFNTDWTWNNNTANYNTRTIMGHVLKTAWCLGRIYQFIPDTAYVSTAEKLAMSVWTKGYDHTYGGPYKDYDRTTGIMLLYGQIDSAKAWWQMEQAVTGGIMLYHVTGKPVYLQMADETLAFFMQYFVDHTYGDVYENQKRRGGMIWNDNKGGSGKAAYHSIETGYYVYLYGNLLLKQQPVTLHYKFAATSAARAIAMNPLDISTAKYRIKSATLNGSAYTAYDANSRTLNIAAGTGGHFTITYEPTSALAVRETPLVPKGFTLSQNYPNPFNPTTTIAYALPKASNVSLKIYDVLGREVATLVNERKAAGSYAVPFNAAGLSSGTYFYRLQAGEFSQTKKLMLVK
jgi:mannose/cellobiose epimerase-like protein (N-acyl-D-glucosamine 2-epimerase family)